MEKGTSDTIIHTIQNNVLGTSIISVTNYNEKLSDIYPSEGKFMLITNAPYGTVPFTDRGVSCYIRQQKKFGTGNTN